MEPCTIYVLELSNGNFYVGRTKNFNKRLINHVNGTGSYWTKKHKYIKTLEILEGDPLLEDMMVKKYMRTYGIDKVRGGSYSNIHLSQSQIDALLRELSNADDRCFNCKQKGHFVNNCPNSIDSNLESTPSCMVCTRCGRMNHLRILCSYSTDIDGNFLDSDLLFKFNSFIRSFV